jgi:hypothetical protein
MTLRKLRPVVRAHHRSLNTPSTYYVEDGEASKSNPEAAQTTVASIEFLGSSPKKSIAKELFLEFVGANPSSTSTW